MTRPTKVLTAATILLVLGYAAVIYYELKGRARNRPTPPAEINENKTRIYREKRIYESYEPVRLSG